MIVLALLLAILPPSADNRHPPIEVDTIYDTPRGMVTLVVGEQTADTARGVPVLTFQDDAGAVVRVYAAGPVDLAQGRVYLERCRDARARAAAVRLRLQAKTE